MPPETAARSPHQHWQPHPDDVEDVREAFACADRGDVLSPEASESFLGWLEGSGDESWRAELE